MTRIHDHLVEDRRDHVAILRIDREDALGALSRDMLEALAVYLDHLAADSSVRALVMTGTGRGFIAGADIGEYDGATFSDFVAYQRLGRAVFDRFAKLPQPVVAAINGYAFGGGLELALCCDFRMSTAKAKFGLPEIKLGLLPGGSGSQRLSRIIGSSRAAELIMTGRAATADEMYRLGVLLREPAPQDELISDAVEFAEQLAASAPYAVRAAKALIRDGAELTVDAAWTLEQSVLAELSTTPDAHEGVRAFVEKRPPVFGG